VLKLLETVDNRSVVSTQKKILRILSLLVKQDQKNIRPSLLPIRFSTLTRSVSFVLETETDHYLLLLITQLFLVNFFTSNKISLKLGRQKVKIFGLIIGKQVLNPCYINRKIRNIDEKFLHLLKIQSQNWELTKKEYHLLMSH